MLQSATAIIWLLGPSSLRICFGCNNLCDWEKVTGKAQVTCLQQLKFSERRVLLHQGFSKWGSIGIPSIMHRSGDGSRGRRKRNSNLRCSGGENSSRRLTALKGKKVRGIFQLISWSRRKMERLKPGIEEGSSNVISTHSQENCDPHHLWRYWGGGHRSLLGSTFVESG